MDELVINMATFKSVYSDSLYQDIFKALTEGILNRWYPLVIDNRSGGYYTNVTADWTLPPVQDKMVVSQARHIWTLSRMSGLFKQRHQFLQMAAHGFPFMKNFMWDQRYGGFFQARSADGGLSDCEGWMDEKRAYGNAFAIYGLAALYSQTRNPEVLQLAQESFRWLESKGWDDEFGGYFQFYQRDGQVFDQNSVYRSHATDEPEVGFKDQNSSIHLLEAFTELLPHWNHPVLRSRLTTMLLLIRDRMTTEKGYLNLFFDRQWNPVRRITKRSGYSATDYRLDHISFGHDYETAFLLLEASHVLGLYQDDKTLWTAKKMVDHSILNGFDHETGGFYDGGQYIDGQMVILKSTKNWWAQAEALNILLIMSEIFPEEPVYAETFLKQWDYVTRYVLDPVKGDWFEGGIDKEPHFVSGPKSHIWKCTYHTGRALSNLLGILARPEYEVVRENPGILEHQSSLRSLINHWTQVKNRSELVSIGSNA